MSIKTFFENFLEAAFQGKAKVEPSSPGTIAVNVPDAGQRIVTAVENLEKNNLGLLGKIDALLGVAEKGLTAADSTLPIVASIVAMADPKDAAQIKALLPEVQSGVEALVKATQEAKAKIESEEAAAASSNSVPASTPATGVGAVLGDPAAGQTHESNPVDAGGVSKSVPGDGAGATNGK